MPGPSTPASPIAPTERFDTIDVLRGVALLGILLLNVRSMAMPADGYVFPLADTAADLWAYATTTVVGQNKFLTIFAALYGAGILLATRRADAAGRPAWPAFWRRSLVLGVVGLAHMTLVWWGDILLLYAVFGLAAFGMRRLPTGWLWVIAGTLYAAALATWAGLFGLAVLGASLDPDFGDLDAEVISSAEDHAAEVEAYRGGYGEQLSARLATAAWQQPGIFILFGPATLGLMLAGMALLKGGFLTGGWPRPRYGLVGVAGVVVGMGGTAAIVAAGWRAGWPPFAWVAWGQLGIIALAPAAAIGIAALVIVNARRLRFLAPVGRMAFTNYLLQSLLGTFVFYGGWGLGYFGMGYLPQLGVVAIIWAIVIALSFAWLARFRYGPLEWLWRGATYGRLPLLRK